MKVLFSRKATLPLSLIVLGLLAVFFSPLGFTPLAILIMVAIAAPIVVVMMLWKEPSLTVAEVIRQADARPAEKERA